MHVLGEHNGTKTEFYQTNTKSHGPCSSIFCIDNYYCCACSKTSISNKYMQKAGEPENDAGFLKHIASGYSFLG